MKVHADNIYEDRTSKSVILFCSKPLHLYNEPDTYDGVNLHIVDLDHGEYIPIVSKLCYLGNTDYGKVRRV